MLSLCLRLALMKTGSFFKILLLPLLSVFYSPDAGLLIFLEADILSIDVLSDMLQERSNSLLTLDVLLCNY